VRRHKAFVAGFAVVFVVLSGGVIASTVEAVRAQRAQNVAVQAEETAIWQSLARESVLVSTGHIDDDLAALLARQSMLIHDRIPDQPQYMVENALQRAAEPEEFGQSLLAGQNRNVLTVAFSPDGTRLAAGCGSYDTIVRVWDLRNRGGPPLLFKGHGSASVNALAFSADGSRLASGGDDTTVRIWDLRNPTNEPIVFQGHNQPVVSLAFSADLTQLVSADIGGNVRMWDLLRPNARPLTTTRISQANITAIALSPDGTRLASGGWDRSVRMWDLRSTGSQPLILQAPKSNRTSDDNIYTVGFSSDGARLASGGGDHLIRVWDLRQPGLRPMLLQGHQSAVSSISFFHLHEGDVDGDVHVVLG
jgi:WD40 repeat protein